MVKLLSNRLWANPSTLATQQGNIIRNSITQLLQHCLKYVLQVPNSPAYVLRSEQYSDVICIIGFRSCIWTSMNKIILSWQPLVWSPSIRFFLNLLDSSGADHKDNWTDRHDIPIVHFLKESIKIDVTEICCCRLQHLFVGLKEEDLAAVKQFKLKALALQLVYIVRASNSSALALCEHFLEQIEDTQRYVFLHANWEWLQSRFASGLCMMYMKWNGLVLSVHMI